MKVETSLIPIGRSVIMNETLLLLSVIIFCLLILTISLGEIKGEMIKGKLHKFLIQKNKQKLTGIVALVVLPRLK